MAQQAIGNLINIVDNAGKLDNTVFMIFEDHKSKGIDLSNKGNLCQVTQKCNSTYNQTSMVIFNKKYTEEKGAMKLATKTTALDILPTLANLFDINYDSRYVFGTDVFDPNYQGFQFYADGIWRTNQFTYNFLTDSVVENPQDLDSDYIKNEIDKIRKTMEIAYDILKSDYFKYDSN